MLKYLPEVLNLIPKFGDFYTAKVNHPNDEKLQSDFWKFEMKFRSIESQLFKELSLGSPEDKFNNVALCYNELNKVDHNIGVLTVMTPTLKKLADIATFSILYNEGNIDDWKRIKSKIEGLMRMSQLF